MLKENPHYRRDAFERGLIENGFELVGRPENADLLVLWNRIGAGDQHARNALFEGKTVLVAENGYLGNDFAGDRWYALSLDHHNGAGRWPEGKRSRWDELGQVLAPFRDGGSEIVILPQRGIGSPGVAMPTEWPQYAFTRLRRLYQMPVRVRWHPGNVPGSPLIVDLMDVAAVATWGSGAALKALVAGIPVLYDFDQWIGGDAGSPIGEPIQRDAGARLEAFRRLAWAMWRVSEIASGKAIQELLACV